MTTTNIRQDFLVPHCPRKFINIKQFECLDGSEAILSKCLWWIILKFLNFFGGRYQIGVRLHSPKVKKCSHCCTEWGEIQFVKSSFYVDLCCVHGNSLFSLSFQLHHHHHHYHHQIIIKSSHNHIIVVVVIIIIIIMVCVLTWWLITFSRPISRKRRSSVLLMVMVMMMMMWYQRETQIHNMWCDTNYQWETQLHNMVWY